MKNVKTGFAFFISILLNSLFISSFVNTVKAQGGTRAANIITNNSSGNLTVYESYTAIKKNGDKVEVHFFDRSNTGFCKEITSVVVTLYNLRTYLNNDTIILVQLGTDKIYRLTIKRDDHLISLDKMNPLNFQPDLSSAKVTITSSPPPLIAHPAINGSIQVSQTNPQSIDEFESLIIKGRKPTGSNIYSKYEPEQRVIQWRESLIKNYMYSDAVFDKLGYNKLMWNTDEGGDGDTYRHCKKGIIVEVRKYEGELSITMTWYPINMRAGIGYLMNCP